MAWESSPARVGGVLARGLQEGSSACEPQLCHSLCVCEPQLCPSLSGAFPCLDHCLRCQRGQPWWGVECLEALAPQSCCWSPCPIRSLTFMSLNLALLTWSHPDPFLTVGHRGGSLGSPSQVSSLEQPQCPLWRGPRPDVATRISLLGRTSSSCRNGVLFQKCL